MKVDNCLYIVFHYMKGYDGNFIISKIFEHVECASYGYIELCKNYGFT